MSTSHVFKYDTLQPRQLRLFKLDLAEPNEPLSGCMITIRHPCHAEWTMRNIVGLAWNWRDTEFIQNKSEECGYDALSYTWGSKDTTYDLLVSTATKTYKKRVIHVGTRIGQPARVTIHGNLHALLQELRRKKYRRFIWIDAICINQEDALEKNLQIPLMKYIYQEARHVYVWLGDATELEMEALPKMESFAKILREAFGDNRKPEIGLPSTFEALGLPLPSDPIWRSFGSVMNRAWFRRLWTLQEAVLPGTFGFSSRSIEVMCGRASIDWKILSEFSDSMRLAALDHWSIAGQGVRIFGTLTGYDAIRMMSLCHEFFKKFAWGVPPWTLIIAGRGKEATNPIDMVFGMYGLLPPGTQNQMTVDVSLPIQEVYVTFAKHYIRNEVDECLLNHLSSMEKMEGLPSWCPNFGSPEETHILGSLWFGAELIPSQCNHQLYHAGFQKTGKWVKPQVKNREWQIIKNSYHQRYIEHDLNNTSDPRQIQLIPDTNYIHVSGISLDEIVEVIKCNPAVQAPEFMTLENLSQTLQWETDCLALAKKTIKDDPADIPDAYIRTLVANQLLRQHDSGEYLWYDMDEKVDLLPDYRGFKNYLQKVVDAGSVLDARQYITPQARRYTGNMTIKTRSRRFFATRGGKIGLGPSDTRIGDSVNIIFFCPTPYIMRSGSEGRSLMVGEAYFHGYMYGQALRMLDQGRVTETQWVVE